MKYSIISIAFTTLIALAVMVVAVPISLGNMAIIAIVMVGMTAVALLVMKELTASYSKEIHAWERKVEALQNQLAWAEKKLEEVNTLDEVSGCFNRRHFVELMQHHRGMAERGQYIFTICAAEVDNFDQLSEHYGTAKRDEILGLIGSILKSAVREVDSVSRMEGAQYGIILAGANEEESIIILSRIRQLISQIQVSEEDPTEITASAGVAEYVDAGEEDDLYERALKALHYAIEQGRNRVAAHVHTLES